MGAENKGAEPEVAAGGVTGPAPAGMVVGVRVVAVPAATLAAAAGLGMVTVAFGLGVVLVAGLAGAVAGWISVAGCKILGPTGADAGASSADGGGA